jgi:hypothetical protein
VDAQPVTSPLVPASPSVTEDDELPAATDHDNQPITTPLGGQGDDPDVGANGREGAI